MTPNRRTTYSSSPEEEGARDTHLIHLADTEADAGAWVAAHPQDDVRLVPAEALHPRTFTYAIITSQAEAHRSGFSQGPNNRRARAMTGALAHSLRSNPFIDARPARRRYFPNLGDDGSPMRQYRRDAPEASVLVTRSEVKAEKMRMRRAFAGRASSAFKAERAKGAVMQAG